MASTESGGATGAGVGRRAAATLIDWAVLVLLAYLIAATTGQTHAGGFELQGWPALLALLVWTSEKRQRLGDRVAETLVVRR